MGRLLRQHFLCWTFCSLYIPSVILIAGLTRGKVHDRFRTWSIRTWGQIMLRICGVRLEVQSAINLRQRTRRIMAFNHSSTLDIFIICALLPDGGVPVVKKEILWIPFLGLGCYCLGFVILDRRNPSRSRQSMDAAARRMRDEDLTVLIAPEGTRTGTETIQPFKTGVCHLARETDSPILPCLIYGASDLFPAGRISCTPGTVVVSVLPEIRTDHFTEENARVQAEKLREIFVQEQERLASNPVRSRPLP